MNKFKKVLTLLLVLAMVLALAACGDKTEPEKPATGEEKPATGEEKPSTGEETPSTGEETPAEVPVLKYMVLSGGTGVDKIETALNARLDELKAGYHVKLIVYGWDNYAEKVGLSARGAAAEEEIFDLATTASWLGPYQTLVREETLLDLTPYLDKQAELKASLTESSIKGATINGGLYGIQTIIDKTPMARDYYGWNVAELEKIGLTIEDVKGIDTVEGLEPILEKYKAQFPEKYPLRGGGGLAFRRINLLTTHADGSYDISNVYAQDWLKAKFEVTARYLEKGYLHPEAGYKVAEEAQQPADQWLVFKSEGEPGAYAVWADSNKTPVFATPAADDTVVYSNVVQGKLTSVYRHTKYPEQALDLIAKIKFDEQVQNILAWGIKGETYNLDENGRATFVEGQEIWNPWQHQWSNDVRYASPVGEPLDSAEMKEKIEAHNKPLIPAVDLGFVPSTELQEKIAQVDAAVVDIMQDVQNGRIGQLQSMIDAANGAGVDDVVTQLTTEFEAWKAGQ
ncbi:MAG: hypothetical protein GXZ08_01005 [Tissierellia bacterium]|nr:hypothetical protein [Tissierellia bacterium]